MVESAGISKGLLFYYFKNKEELFRYALEYSLEYIKREYVDKLDLSEPDFILRLQKITEVKMRAYLTNPLPFTFIASVQLNQDMEDVVPDLFARWKKWPGVNLPSSICMWIEACSGMMLLRSTSST